MIFFSCQFQHSCIELFSSFLGSMNFISYFLSTLLKKSTNLTNSLILKKTSIFLSFRLLTLHFLLTIFLMGKKTFNRIKRHLSSTKMIRLSSFSFILNITVTILTFFIDKSITKKLDIRYFSTQFILSKIITISNLSIKCILSFHLSYTLFFLH